MTIYSYLHKIYQNYDSEKKGRLLSKAIQKANQVDDPFLNNYYWTKLAIKLLNDPKITRHYVPIRYVIQSLESGNIEIATKLYLNPDNKEIYHRINETVIELFYLSRRDPHALEQVDEANHLLDTIAFMAEIIDLKDYEYSVNYIRTFILKNWTEPIPSDTMLHTNIVKEILTFILSQNLNTPENVIRILPYFKKLTPTTKLSSLHSMISTLKPDNQNLPSDFPSDIIKNKDGTINIVLTFGLKVDLFTELENQDMSSTSDEYYNTLEISSAMNKTMYHIYNNIKNFKTIKNYPKKLTDKPLGKKSVHFNHLHDFSSASMKNLKDSHHVNINPNPFFLDETILNLDPKQMNKYSEDGSMLHKWLSESLHQSSLELHDTRNLSSSQTGSFKTQSKWYNTSVFNRSFESTAKSFTTTLSQTQHRVAKKYKWAKSDARGSKTIEFDKTDSTKTWYETFIFKWLGSFTKTKIAITDEMDTLRSTTQNLKLSHQRVEQSKETEYYMEDTSICDKAFDQLHETDNQPHHLNQLNGFDETNKSSFMDPQNVSTTIFMLDQSSKETDKIMPKDLDNNETFIKVVDNSSDTNLLSETDDSVHNNSSITVIGDIMR